jgi:hypothetical protein
MGTLSEIITAEGITARAKPTDANPAIFDMGPGARHWRVTLRRGRSSMTVPFSQGPAHTHPPDAVDVLSCLASDASGFDDARSFEEWADNYGYDTDSRKVERTYRAVQRQTERLRAWAGPAYDDLLDHYGED